MTIRDAKKCCKTCKHSRWQLTPTGRIKLQMAGECVAEFVEPILPSCIVRPTYHRVYVWPDRGEECPLWAENTGKPKGGR